MTGRPLWDVDAYIHAKTEQETPVSCAEAKVRLIIYDDDSWSVIVNPDGQSFHLMLQGTEASQTSATLREVFGFVFGRAA